MRRVDKHQSLLSKLVNDERLSPHRRLLAEMLILWLESEGEVRERVLKLIEAQFGTPRRIKWGEGKQQQRDIIDLNANTALKDFFIEAREESALPTETVHIASE